MMRIDGGHIGVVKLMLIMQHAQLLLLSGKLAPNDTLALSNILWKTA